MKILFITLSYDSSFSGGAVGSKRNYDMLCQLFGKDNVAVLPFKEKPHSTLTQKIYKNICKFVTAEQFELSDVKKVDFSQYDCVFLDTSLIGLMAKRLREKRYGGKIISYFHNCEIDLYTQMYGKDKWVIRYPLLKLAKVNEQAALNYSDASIALNKRDLDSIKTHYYVKTPVYTIPVSMEDKVKKVIETKVSSKPIYTFLGSYFKPNVDGIIWFIDNVLPYVDIHLRIIGRGMSKLREKYNIPHVEILSDVPDLEKYLLEADYMLYPIFEGSGMKLKTCEALMYGKNIIGTSEAFCGYDIDDFAKIGAKCDNKEDFINAIKNVHLPHFNEYSRELYIQKYSYQASLRQFREVFKYLKLL